MTSNEVKKIHDGSLWILENIGIKVENKKCIKIFCEHGCNFDSQTETVRIPRVIIEELIKLIPRKFTYYGRDAKFDITLPDDAPVFSASGEAPNIIDIKTGKIRSSLSSDTENISYLFNEMSGYDIACIMVAANEFPANCAANLFPAMKNCLKPIRTPVTGGNMEELKKALNLCYLVAGGKDAFRKRPFVTFCLCPLISPLKLDNDHTEMLIYLTKNRLPTNITICPNAGLTSPMSFVGSLAQTNAEFLATVAIRQMVWPGAPVIYSTLPTAADLRSGAYASGGIESGILAMGFSQMARYYDVPCYAVVGQTNSKIVDAQAAYEESLSSSAAILSGADLIIISGLLDSLMVFDYGMLMIGNEIAQMLKRLRSKEYFYTNQELEAALELIRQVGPGGNYLSTKHTLKRMRTFLNFPEIADRSFRQKWEENGSLNAYERALKKVSEILKIDNPILIENRFSDKIIDDINRLIRSES